MEPRLIKNQKSSKGGYSYPSSRHCVVSIQGNDNTTEKLEQILSYLH